MIEIFFNYDKFAGIKDFPNMYPYIKGKTLKQFYEARVEKVKQRRKLYKNTHNYLIFKIL